MKRQRGLQLLLRDTVQVDATWLFGALEHTLNPAVGLPSSRWKAVKGGSVAEFYIPLITFIYFYSIWFLLMYFLLVYILEF